MIFQTQMHRTDVIRAQISVVVLLLAQNFQIPSCSVIIHCAARAITNYTMSYPLPYFGGSAKWPPGPMNTVQYRLIEALVSRIQWIDF